jgi:hypothetical protein
MALLYSGSTGYRELAPILRETEKGQTTTRRWRGLLPELRDLAPTVPGREKQIVQEDDVWFVLEATATGWPDKNDNAVYPTPDEQVVRLYSLRGTQLGKSIWDLNKVAKQMAILRDLGGKKANLVGVARYRSDLMALARGEEVVFSVATKDASKEHGEAASTTSLKITLSGLLGIAQEAGMDASIISDLYEQLANGVEGYNIDTFTLRRRSVGPNGANLLPAYLDMGKAIRTGTLLNRITDCPSSVRNVLPDGFWVPNAPNLDQTDRDRLELIEEWVFADRVSEFIYEVV